MNAMTRLVRKATPDDEGAVAYLRRDLTRNALSLWSLLHEGERYSLSMCIVDGRVSAHLGVFFTPEGNYADAGGEVEAAKELLRTLPRRAVLTAPIGFERVIRAELRHDAIYPNDIMIVRRGQEELRELTTARKLTIEDEADYSQFGSSFNVKRPPPWWIRDRLENNAVFGAFAGDELASVASLAAWLPEVSVLLGVETKRGFRRRGFGATAVSAAVREGLKRSEACTLFVRSDNHDAVGLYRGLGFREAGKELWVDIGTGMVP